MKIPTELPKNFDYYADKSLSRSTNKKSNKSDQYILEELKQDPHSQRARRMLNAVRSSSKKHHTVHNQNFKSGDERLSKVSKSSKSRGKERLSRLAKNDDKTDLK
jgi:hypothetical protein